MRTSQARRHHSPPANEELRGKIERVRFLSPQNGWSVLDVRVENASRTVVGVAPGVRVGEDVHARGAWVTDPRYGPRFEATHILCIPPITRAALEHYLASGAILGVGAQLAHKLVQHFGEQLPQVLDSNPVYLESIAGIGPARRRRIADSWSEQRPGRDTLLFLHQHAISRAQATQLQRRYGDRTISVLRADPYRIIGELAGVGFVTADDIARRLGVKADDPRRLSAGLHHTLHQQRLRGHCAMAESKLLASTAELLATDPHTVTDALSVNIKQRRLIRDAPGEHPLVYFPRTFNSEVAVAAHLRRLLAARTPWGEIPLSAVADAERREGLTLSASQREAIERALQHNVFVLYGGPGSGKTTIMRVLVSIVCARLREITLGAPTAIAAAKLQEATGWEAATLHRTLMGTPESMIFGRNAQHPLDSRFVIVDEMSLADLEITRALLEAIPQGCALALVGDPAQLPSVGAGQVLQDLISCGALPAVRLREPHRQAAQSSIIRAAHAVLDGRLPDSSKPGEDFQWIIENDPRAIGPRMLDLISDELPQTHGVDPRKDVQVLSPMRRGELGTIALNTALQKRLNPHPRAFIEHAGVRLGVGDRVLHTTNDYTLRLFNGELGLITGVMSARRLRIDFAGREVTLPASALKSLALSYAITVHKSQGSEYPTVVMPLTMAHYLLLSRRLLNTAFTRAKVRVFVVGEEKAMHAAVQSAHRDERTTGLRERLRAPTA